MPGARLVRAGGFGENARVTDDEREPRILVVPPDGSRPEASDDAPDDPTRSGRAGSGDGPEDDADDEDVRGMVAQPAKVMRIGTMVKQLLDEVRSAPLDEAARARLAEVHERSLAELEEGLSPELIEELHRITLPFTEDATPSDAELRIAQAQLVGWLEGLFHGIQTALVAQQMATQAQLQQMRRALPPGAIHPTGLTGHAQPSDDERGGTGQYL